MESIKGLEGEALANAVFEQVKGDLMALKPEELQPIKLDIAAAVTTVLGVIPELQAQRAEVVLQLPKFDIEQFDKLEQYALALSFAQAKFLSATQPADDLDAAWAEASKLRERLLAEARTLTHYGLLGSAQLEQLKGAKGYKNTATDVLVLSSLLQANWEKIQGRTPTTLQDLEHASRVATRLMRIVGLREQGPAMIAEATDQRLRAYTKLLLVYDDARRAIAFLRGAKEDADSIAPSLFPGRPRPKKSDADDATQVPAGSVPPPAVGSAPGVPAATAPASGTVPTTTPATPAQQPASVSAQGPFMS